MARYIDADWLMKQWEEPTNWIDKEQVLRHYLWFKSVIELAPTADVRENVHGEWTEKEVITEEVIYEWQSACCSKCGKYHTTPYMYYFNDYNFCPNCGADMRGAQDG